MQVVIAILLAVSVAEIQADHFTYVRRTIANFASNVGFRQKRADAGSKQCLEKCQKILDESIKNKNLYANHDGSSGSAKNLADLELECSEFKKSKSCFEKCNAFSITVEVNKIFCEKMKQEVIASLPCFVNFKKNSTSEDVFKKACGPKCAAEESAVKNLKSLSNIAQPLCKYMNCEVSCVTEVLVHQCPNNPKFANLMREVGKTLIAKGAIEGIKEKDAALATLLEKECLKTH